MTEEEINEIVSRNEDICSAMVGAMKALEYGVRTLIAVHPEPELLSGIPRIDHGRTWRDQPFVAQAHKARFDTGNKKHNYH